jgi:hypothetical protein
MEFDRAKGANQRTVVDGLSNVGKEKGRWNSKLGPAFVVARLSKDGSTMLPALGGE